VTARLVATMCQLPPAAVSTCPVRVRRRPDGASGDWIGTHVGTNCQLHGDFDVQVEYELLIWPAANGVAAS